MKKVLIFLFFAVVCLCEQSDASVSLSGDGSYMFRSLFDYWSFAYNLVDTEISITYNSVNPGQELAQVKSDPTKNDFANLCVGSTTDLSLQDPDFDYFPLFAASLVPVYNVPGLVYDDPENEATPILSLSRETLADIFRGRIYTWDDERISLDNPNVILPNRTILVVTRNDATSLTSVWLQAMNSFVPDWEYGTNTTWPASYAQVKNHAGLTGEGTIAAVTNFPYSIAYTTLGIVLEQGPVTYARLINKAGNTVGAEADQIVAALDSISSSENPTQFVDRNDGWPIISVQYQAILKDNCNLRRELFKFYNWIKISDTAADRLANGGGATLGSYLENTTKSFLTSYTCGGNLVLEYKAIPQHQSKAFVALLSLGMILLTASICLGFTWHYFTAARCTKEVILYQIVQMLGIVVTYLSVIFWYAIPTVHEICSLRRWMTCIGFTLVFAAMFERTFRIHRVFGRVYKNNKLTGNISSLLEVGGGVTIILVSQIIIMVVWSAVDPYKAEFRPIDEISFESEHICTLNYPNTWLALEAVYYGILLIWGVYVVYSTWALKNSILESRWILVSMYNNLLLLTLCATILPIIELNDDLLFEIMVPLILLANTNVVVAVYLPGVLKKLKILVSSSGSDVDKTSATATELEKVSGSK